MHWLPLVLYVFIIHFTSRNAANNATLLLFCHYVVICLSKKWGGKKISILYLPVYLPFSVFLIPFCQSRFPPGVMSLSAEELPGTFLLVQVCRRQIFLAFVLFFSGFYVAPMFGGC